MTTRCKPGDLAIIVVDVPCCAVNLGRIVRVRSPLGFSLQYQQYCWRIKPFHNDPMLILECDGSVTRERIFWNSQIHHPDRWMLPIRADDVPEKMFVRTRLPENTAA